MIARVDGFIVFMWGLLIVIGITFVSSVTSPLTEYWLNPLLLRHLVYVALAMVVFAIVTHLPLQVYQKTYRFSLLAAIALAAIVLVPFIGRSAGGSQRWIDLGFFSIQVSEWIRLLLLIYVAGHVSEHYEKFKQSTLSVVWLILLVGLVMSLVVLEPDFGTVVIIAVTTFGMLFLAQTRMRDLLTIGLLGGAAIAFVAFLKPYRVERITTFLDPWDAPFGAGYQLTQALIALGRGELFGVGLGASVQKHSFLPAAHNDFIFAVIVEETGFVGATLIVALLVVLVLKCWFIARRAMESDFRFGGLLAYGAGLIIALQLLISIGVNTGLLPTKGLTLPFISFGGNSLLLCTALVALVSRVKFETNQQYAT